METLHNVRKGYTKKECCWGAGTKILLACALEHFPVVGIPSPSTESDIPFCFPVYVACHSSMADLEARVCKGEEVSTRV